MVLKNQKEVISGNHKQQDIGKDICREEKSKLFIQTIDFLYEGEGEEGTNP